MTPTIAYLLQHLPDLLYRDFLQEILCRADRCRATRQDDGQLSITSEAKPYVGKLVVLDGMFHRVESFTRQGSSDRYTVIVTETGIEETDGVILNPRTPFVLEPGCLANFMTGEKIVTSFGRVICNFLILAYPFGDVIPYINGVWKASVIEKLVGDAIIQKQVTPEQVNIYIDNLLFIGHSPELCSPNLTEKTLTTDPQIKVRKRELLEQHKEALAAGDAVVMSQIENELIAMDKAWLKGDESMNYLLKAKQFDVIRKKLFLTHGMVESFGKRGDYNFVDNSLEEGWTQNAFPVIANEIRAGSFARAKETAKGGEESKFILRVFQNTRIKEQDCGSTRTLDVDVHAYNSDGYIYRNYLTESGVDTVTADNHKSFIGKRVRFRSPMYCTARAGGYCYTCMGKLFESLQQDTMATVMNAMGAQFTVLSLKSMHGSSVKTVEINSLNKFLVK